MADSAGLEIPYDKFLFNGKFIKAERTTIGHINDTFIVHFDESDEDSESVSSNSEYGLTGQTSVRYIIQRINDHVFKNPEQVMENIEAVTDHLRKKIIASGGDPARETLNLIRTTDGRTFIKTAEGHYWRAYYFIDGARTYESADDPRHFYNAGKAFGLFQKNMSDFPADSLYETIRQFHDTRKRYNDLLEAIENDTAGRVSEVTQDIGFAKEREAIASVVVDMLADGKLPLRVIHNDTKLNNVLIDDATGEGICVLDLDTVMPGSSLYDFGDAIRFGANTAAEDEQDLSKVTLDLDLFRSFAKGFIEAAGDALTRTEYDHLAFSSVLMTYEVGLRFLTDYLNGDVYFRVERPGHNLDRARSQFKLVSDMETKLDQMKAIVESERKAVMGE